MPSEDFKVKEPGLRECWREIVVIALFCALLFCGAMWPLYQQRIKDKNTRIALVIKRKVKAAKVAKISTAKIGKFQKKRKTKMEKIAIGQTKTFEVEIDGDISVPYNNHYFSGETDPGYSNVITNGIADGTGVTLSWPPFEWEDSVGKKIPVTVDLLTTVAPGVYTYTLLSNANVSQASKTAKVQFEVICIEKIVITKTKID